MSKSDPKKLEQDVMQALESLRAILDKDADEDSVGAAEIPTLSAIVAAPKGGDSKSERNESMQPLSLFDELLPDAEPSQAAAVKPVKKAEEQLTLPQVSELDKHHGVDPARAAEIAAQTTAKTVCFDDYWRLLEPKLKQVAEECFNTLLEAESKPRK